MPRVRRERGDTRVSPAESSLAVAEGVVFELVPTNTRPLIEVGPKSMLWKHPEEMPSTDGIVKATPPARATDEEVEAFRAAMKGAGAVAVRILPRIREQEAVAGDAERSPAKSLAHRDLRGAAIEVARASTYADKDALVEEVERFLGEVGL